MKLYYFMVIAIGLMWTFHLAGIQTGSSHILNSIQGLWLNETDVNPVSSGNGSSYEVYDVVNPSRALDKSTYWAMISLALSVLVAIGGLKEVKILGSGISMNPIASVTAGVATFICSMFAFDFFSIVHYMNQITGGTGWEYYLTWVLIFPILVGFVFSLIEFVQGKD